MGLALVGTHFGNPLVGTPFGVFLVLVGTPSGDPL